MRMLNLNSFSSILTKGERSSCLSSGGKFSFKNARVKSSKSLPSLIFFPRLKRLLRLKTEPMNSLFSKIHAPFLQYAFFEN